ncbi:unnamed protein product [Caenorhabditis bovis]|uniref:Uncharacterized protein n=1 Tax=Caenorhabditis bovis TaxID=2654633 RepID=A0A8S1FBI5_9PELO|nr:unnamed protein product [Caenorhabditis bovis]
MFRLGLFLSIFGRLAAGYCSGDNFRNVVKGAQSDDYLIYGLTQDCQMFFLRPSQLHLLSRIQVNARHSFCYSNLIQLHFKSNDTLLLVFKQAANRICTLDIHIPRFEMLFGDHLFRYSLLNSLPYASCSHSLDTSFQLEPDLSFMDPVYSDVLYMVDALSIGSKWKVFQFLLKDTGILSMMNNLTIANQYPNENAPANEFIISIDSERDKLFRRNRFDRVFDYQCSFNMLFRSSDTKVQSFASPNRGYGSMLNTFSVDGDIMLYAESDRSTEPPTTSLNILNIDQPDKVFCLLSTSYTYEIGLIQKSTFQKSSLPSFAAIKKPNPTSSTNRPTAASSKKTKNQIPTLSPSKSFFRYENKQSSMTTTTTTEYAVVLGSAVPDILSNDIPEENLNEDPENEDGLDDIIRDLNEPIAELKTSEITTPTILNGTKEQNSTSDQAVAQASSESSTINPQAKHTSSAYRKSESRRYDNATLMSSRDPASCCFVLPTPNRNLT